MPAIFSRTADAVVRQIVLGAVVAAGLFTTGWYYYALPSYTRVGYQPDQPVPFSHQLHAGQLGLDCRYCHTHVTDSPHSNVPGAQTCMNCHNKEKANVKGNSPLLQSVYDSYKTGTPIAWRRVHKLPEYAYFNHSAHITKGVSCVSCHGLVNEMAVVWHDQPLSMGWCLKCHAEPEKYLRPVAEVTNLTWKPPPGQTQAEIGSRIRDELAIKPPSTCQGCHR